MSISAWKRRTISRQNPKSPSVEAQFPSGSLKMTKWRMQSNPLSATSQLRCFTDASTHSWDPFISQVGGLYSPYTTMIPRLWQ